MSYGKWLGGGLGWLVGGPIGGLLGFVAGNMINEEPEAEAASEGSAASELEACLMVMASHIIHADGKVSLKEIDEVRKFIINTAGEARVDAKMQVLNHCLNHQYELEKACGYIRIYQNETVTLQTLRLMYDVAACDGALSEREHKLLFYMAGQLNINDIVYNNLMQQWTIVATDDFTLFDLPNGATQVEIRNTYRRLVLKIHPDRNAHYSEAQKKAAERQMQLLREAYERLSGN